MAKFVLTKRAPLKQFGVLVALFCADAALPPAAAVENGKIPDLTLHSQAGWMEIGDELLAPPSGPGPVTNDPRYPYVDNGAARRRGIQPTYRIANLDNPYPAALDQGADEKDNDGRS